MATSALGETNSVDNFSCLWGAAFHVDLQHAGDSPLCVPCRRQRFFALKVDWSKLFQFQYNLALCNPHPPTHQATKPTPTHACIWSISARELLSRPRLRPLWRGWDRRRWMRECSWALLPTHRSLCESNALVRATAGVVSATFGTVSYFVLINTPPCQSDGRRCFHHILGLWCCFCKGGGGTKAE